MPNADYAVSGSTGTNNRIRFQSKTSLGFTAVTVSVQSTNTPQDAPFDFTVFATNALPPKGGTGTDAWGNCLTDGTVNGSFNVASVTRTEEGTYRVDFTTPMPTASYAVNATINRPTGTPQSYWAQVGLQETTGFTVYCTRMDYNSGGTARSDKAFNFTVNATNATLPDSFSEEQIQSVVDLAQSGATNPGASAWGDIAADGTINGGMNVASVVNEGTGIFTVTFSTPMPNSNYSVVATSGAAYGYIKYVNKTSTGFQVNTYATDGAGTNYPFGFTVFATNALPPKGGTGTDAWASCASGGAIEGSFNIAECTYLNGDYAYVFTTPMPTANYAVVATQSRADTNAGVLKVIDKTTTGFTVSCYKTTDGQPISLDHSVVVNATNATLPNTVTQEQIDTVLNTWTRDGTTLKPVNSGDSVTLEGGLRAFQGTKNFSIIDRYITSSDVGLVVNNGNLLLGASGAIGFGSGIANTTSSSGTPLQAFSENGYLRIYKFTSLRSYKTNIQPLPSVWDKVKALSPCSFNGIGEQDKNINSFGFIAEEVDTVDAHFGTRDENGLNGVSYPAITVALTAALKEAMTRIETLEAKVQTLENN
jgi:hypothetical protein